MKLNKKLIFIIIVLLCTNGATLGYVFYQQTYNYNKLKSIYPYIDPTRNIIPKEHFLSTLQPVRNQFNKIVEEAKPNDVSVYMEYLNTGANISINQDKRFWPASLSKLPTAFVVMKKIEKGEWKLSNELVLFEQDKDDRFGDLYKKPVGSKFTIEYLLKQLLINSDNTAHSILVRNLASDEYTNMLEALGLNNLFDKNYDITAKEYSRLFRSLYSANYLDRAGSNTLLQWLTESKFSMYLGSGIPKDVQFSHKIGEDQKELVFLDSGIVYVQNRPYLITVMIHVKEKGGEKIAKDIMKKFSTAAYAYISKN